MNLNQYFKKMCKQFFPPPIVEATLQSSTMATMQGYSSLTWIISLLKLYLYWILLEWDTSV